jgi:PQQ-dependent dehydrogenase (methanol/ethanol family)
MKPDTRNLLVTTAVIWLAGGGVYFLGNSLPGAKAPPAHESADAEEPSSPKPPAAIALSAPPAEPAPAAPAPAPAATASVDELLTLSKDPKQWVSPTGDYANLRHSGLKQITADNVGSLQPAWQFSTGVLRGHEGAPLVLNNVSVTDSSGKTLTTDVMYLHTPFPNIVYALDAKDPAHQILWKYEPKQDPSVVPVMCCDTVNRGLAYGDGKIFLAQADTTLIALDAKTGKLVWSVKNGDPAKGQTSTAAPHVFKDKVLVGIAGGEFGVRGHITAYSIKDGKQVWRGYSMGPDADTLIEPGKTTHLGKPVEKDSGITTWEGNQWETGGGTTWGWYSYDPELNQIFYGSGNPSTWNPVQRPGDNRWSMTLWSRDLDTGKVKWVYQMTPHDEWDYDGINEVILADQNIGGKTVKTAVHFDRNGFAYTLDRTNGELLVAEKYDPAVNWATKVDLDKSSKTYGRPLVVDKYSTQHNGEDTNTQNVCPAALGSKDEQPASYDAATGLFLVPTNHVCMDYEPFRVSYTAGQPYVGATLEMFPAGKVLGDGTNHTGNFIAWDAKTGKIVWSNKEQFSAWGGAVSTDGGVTFYGTLEGYLKAVDTKTGKELYKYKTPSGIIGNVITYESAGKQYVAVLSGVGGWAGIGLAAGLSKSNEGLGAVGNYASLANYTALGGVLTVFALPN